MDSAEAIANATVGLAVSWLAVWLLWPVFGWQASPTQAVGVTAMFWTLSAVRAYAIRKVFRKWGK